VVNNQGPENKDQWMVVNNFQTLKWIQRNKDKTLSLDFIKELHAKITTNTFSDEDLKYIGVFRDHSIRVGNHKGVDQKFLETSLNESIESIIHNPRFIHPLVKGILLHYFLAYIHPFTDGNGRTGRSLIYFQAIKEDLDFIQFLSLSAQFKFTGKRYIKTFDLVLNNGLDLTYFVDFCLDGFLQALKKVGEKVDFLLSLKDLKIPLKLNDNQLNLIQFLATNKYYRIPTLDYASMIGKTREMARKDLKDLLAKGLVKEKKIAKKLFYSIEIKNLRNNLKVHL
jgi:Fic family protein